MTILPLTYLGGVEWFTHFAAACDPCVAGCDCVIDMGENWVKQTSRNRAEVLTVNGPAMLTVPVHSYGEKIRTRDVRVDNSKRWQHVHWLSMVSAYRNSPFFDHYEHRFAPVYEKRFDFLVDLNLELLGIITSTLWPELPTGAVRISEHYVAASPGDVDLRGKKALRRPESADIAATYFRPYTQVFSDRMPFIPGLSIADMLFCEGPSTRELLRLQATR